MANRKIMLGTQQHVAASPSFIDSLRAHLKSFVSRYIAAEHICTPPGDGRMWVPVSANAAEQACANYQCPECGQAFSANKERQVLFSHWSKGLQRQGVAI